MGVRLTISPVTVVVQVNTGGGGGGDPVTFETVRDALAQADTPVDFNGEELTSLADPTGPQSAATRAYVDANASGVGSRIELDDDIALTNVSRGNTYVATAAEQVTATLPASNTIGAGVRWVNRFVASSDGLVVLAQGGDSLLYYGASGAGLTSINAGDSIDIEYIGNGTYNVVGVVGQGWVFP